MSDKAPVVQQSSTGSGTSYVEKQVAERGWPMPNASMMGGKRHTKHGRRSRKHVGKRSVKRGGCGCGLVGGKKSRGKKSSRRGKKGGFMGLIKEAIVPFGIYALQKRSQRKHRAVSGSKKTKSYRNKSYRNKSYRK